MKKVVNALGALQQKKTSGKTKQTQTFGVPLKELLQRADHAYSDIPLVVEETVRYLERNGGLYPS